MTPEKELEILTAVRLSLRPATAANANGVRAQTLHSHTTRHPEFTEKVEQAVATCERRALISVVEKYDTDLREAANMLAQEEQALQLRYLQTLKEVANEKTNTIVFPMPLEFVEPIMHMLGKDKKA